MRKYTHSVTKSNSESGNIFFALFGAIALVGIIGASTVAIMRGPLSTMVEVQSRTQAESEMAIASRLSLLEATQLTADGDCDADGFVEPLEFTDAGGNGPTGGGFLPAEVSSNRTDPWGTEYGYCAWDAGSITNYVGTGYPDTCDNGGGSSNGSYNRLAGSGSASDETYSIVAIISAGANMQFETTCTGGATPDVTKGGDDIVVEYTYESAVTATNGLWNIKTGEPGVAEIDKEIEVAGNIDLNRGGSGTGQLLLGAGSMIYPDQTVLTVCPGAANVNVGLIRMNRTTSPLVLEICDTTGWVSVGGTGVWTAGTGDDIYYNQGTPQVGIGTTTPDNTLDVVGTFDVTGAVTFGSTLDVTGAGTFNELHATGDLSAGDAFFSGDVQAQARLTAEYMEVNTTLDVIGAVDFDSTLNVDGVATLGNNLTVLGNTNLDGTLSVNLDTLLQEDLQILGLTDFQGNIYNSISDLNLDDNVIIADSLDIQGPISNSTGNVSINDSLDVVNNLDVNGSADIDGTMEADEYTWNGNDFTPATCASGNFNRWDGTSWVCEDDIAGTSGGSTGTTGGIWENTSNLVRIKDSAGDWNADDFVFGSDRLADVSGQTWDNSRMFFDKSKGAFRAGYAATQWDDANVGQYSVALGFAGIAKGGFSNSIGYMNSTNGMISTALGDSNVVDGNYSTAIGSSNSVGTASTYYSHAFGNYNLITGGGSFAFGEGNTVGDAAASLGFYNTANGFLSTSLGTETLTHGFLSTAIGTYVRVGNGTASDGNNLNTGLGDFSMGIGLGYGGTGVYPRITGDSSLGIFMGDQSGYDLTTDNRMALVGGDFLIDDVGATGSNGCIRYSGATSRLQFSHDCTTWSDMVGASSIVGGSDTQVQYNDGGAFAGDAGLTYDDANNILTVGNAVTITGQAGNAPTYMNLDDLGDVDAASPANGECLVYNNGSGNWESAACTSSGTAVLSGLTAATADNTINNAAWNQIWNWQLTGNEYGFLISENAASTGGSWGAQSLFAINTVASSTAAPLLIQNAGTNLSFAVADEASDTSPFVIDASGNVGVGTSSPSSKLHINGVTTFNGILTNYSTSFDIVGTDSTGGAGSDVNITSGTSFPNGGGDPYPGGSINITSGLGSHGDYDGNITLSVSPTDATPEGVIYHKINNTDLLTIQSPEFSDQASVIFGANTAIQIPSGTTAQRPDTPAAGMIRYNATTNKFEVYENGAWVNMISNGAADITSGVWEVASSVVRVKSSAGYDSNDFVFGSPALDSDGDSDHESRFFFNKTKSAFRAGISGATAWNNVNVGSYSFATGESTTASGSHSFAAGSGTIATGTGSAAFGTLSQADGNNSFTAGSNIVVSGLYSAAFGQDSNITGGASFSVGETHTVSGSGSFTSGSSNTVSGNLSSSMGYVNVSSGNNSHTIGSNVTASGQSTYAIGLSTSSSVPASNPNVSGSSSVGIFMGNQSGYTLSTANRMALIGGHFMIDDVGATGSNGCFRYNGGTSKLQFSNDCTTYTNIDSVGSTSGVFEVTGAIGSELIRNNNTYAPYATSDFVFGSSQTADVVGQTWDDARMFFDKSKYAFRVGYAETQWDDANVGDGSISMGVASIASGQDSVSIGTGNTASGQASYILGIGSTASSQWSMALGAVTTASGQGALATGYSTIASGYHSTAMGHTTTTSGYNATAFGSTVRVGNGTASDGTSPNSGLGDYSMGIGLGLAAGTAPQVTGDSSFGIFMGDQSGIDVAASNTMSVMGGDLIVGSYQLDDTTTGNQDNRLFFDVSKGAFRAGYATGDHFDAANVGNYSAAFGERNRVAGQGAFSAGTGNTSSGANSTTLGSLNTASAQYSVALGYSATASGYQSLAWGWSSDASGNTAVAIGSNADAAGDSSIVLGGGNSSTGTGDYSMLMGYESIASGLNSVLLGRKVTTTATATHSAALGLGNPAGANPQISGDYSYGIFMGDQSGYDLTASNRMALVGGDFLIDDAGATGSNGCIRYDGTNSKLQFSHDCSTYSDLTAGGAADVTSGVWEIASNVVRIKSTAGSYTNDDFVFGSSQTADVAAQTWDNSRMFFDKSKGAFRVGSVTDDRWDSTDVGDYSFAGGYNTIAAGNYSFAFGTGSDAQGFYSVAIGENNYAGATAAIVMGANSTADGTSSIAIGSNNTASGDYSTAMGREVNISASGDGSMGIGLTTTSPATDPIISGAQSLGIFMGNQSGYTLSTANRMALVGGHFMIDDAGATGSNGCIRYDGTNSKLQFSHDCSTYSDMGALSGAIAINDLSDAMANFATDGNMFIGHEGTSVTTGSGIRNLGIGYTAADSLTTGDENVAIGRGALTTATTQSDNTAIGNYALYYTASNENTAIGSGAMRYYAGTGGRNTAIGAYAGPAVSGGLSAAGNVSVGFAALQSSTAGDYNVAIGGNALVENQAKGESTAVGYGSMRHMDSTTTETPSYNSALGFNSLRGATAGAALNTGTGNTAIGHTAIQNITSGNNNTALGYLAGDTISAGSNNIAIGYNADFTDGTASNQLNIGDTIYGDLSTDQIAIGTATQTTNIQFKVSGTGGIIVPSGTTAQRPTAIETGMFRYNTTATPADTLEYYDAEGATWRTLLASGAGAVSALDDLSDAITNYTDANMYLGSGNGDNTTTGVGNTALGNEALAVVTTAQGTTAVGRNALTALETGNGNSAFGNYALSGLNGGNENTAVGGGAGGALLGGQGNTAIGSTTMYAPSTRSYNTAVGFSAMEGGGSGGYNTALGVYALQSNSGKAESTAVGYGAMRYSDDAAANSVSYNTAVGAYALQGSTTAANNTGESNTAIGHSSLLNNTTGSYNIAVGTNTLADNQGGYGNTGIGNWALRYSNASKNTAIGWDAMQQNRDGEDNIAIGVSAMYSNEALTQGVAIGNEAMRYADNTSTGAISYNTAVGYQALRGSTTPANNTGTANTAIGHSALLANTAGSENVAVGSQALTSANNAGAGNNVAIGSGAMRDALTSYNNVAIGQGAMLNADSGNDNVAIGRFAGVGLEGNSNVAVGASALIYGYGTTNSVAVGRAALSTATGDNNIALGHQAGDNITTGASNIMIGYDIDAPSATGNNQLVIGNTIYGDLSTDQIAIGTATQTADAQFKIAGTGSIMIPTGTDAQRPATGAAGMVRYNSTATPADKIEYYDAEGAAWVQLGAGGSSLWTDNTTHITREGVHILDTGATMNSSGFDYGGVASNTISGLVFMTDLNAIVGGQNDGTDDSYVGNASFAWGSGYAAGDRGISLGSNTGAGPTGVANIAIGGQSNSNNSAIVIGYNSSATGIESNAFGKQVSATGFQAMAFGAGETAGTRPVVSGNQSIGFFMGDQDSVDLTQSNTMAIMGGSLNVGTVTPTTGATLKVAGTGSIMIPSGTDAQRPATGSAGMVRYNSTATPADKIEYYDAESAAWVQLAAGSSTTALSALTLANATNTIDNTNYAQAWNWSTLSTETAIAINANAITSGKALNIASSSTGMTGSLVDLELSGSNAANTGNVFKTAITGTSSTGTPLMVTNLGAGLSMRVNDETGDTDTSPFVIDASGNVGINTAAPTGGRLHIAGATDAAADTLIHLVDDRSALINIQGGTNTFGGGINFQNSSAANQYQFYISGGGTELRVASNQAAGRPFIFYDNITSVMLTDTRAQLAIGTATQTTGAQLKVAGTGSIMIPSGTDAQRPATGAAGMVRYNSTATPADKIEYYDAESAAWVQLGSGGGGAIDDLSDAISDTTSTVFLGTGSGAANIGTGNTALGINTLASNIGKRESTAIGLNAMRYADDTATSAVTYNTALGAYALQGSTTAVNNTGIKNTAIGHSSLISNTSGNSNTAVGTDSMTTNTTGIENVALGLETLKSSLDGNYSVAIGTKALYAMSGGGNNIAIGAGSMQLASSSYLNIALGTGSLNNVSANYNIGVGASAGASITNGQNNIAMGHDAGATTLTTGSDNILIGNTTDTPAAGTNNHLNIGNTIYGDLSNDYVGIGNIAPSVALDVTGDIEYTGTITDVSDMRLKDNIAPLIKTGSLLERIDQIDTYSFSMKNDKAKRTEFGVMAQELEKIFPELVHTASDEIGTKSVNYVGLIAPMIEATKELRHENKEMKAALNDLNQQVALLNKIAGNNVNKASTENIWMLMFGLLCGIGGMLVLQRKNHSK